MVYVEIPFYYGCVKVHEMQLALKKQEKLWKKRMQKLGASYLDQIKDVRL